MCTTPFFVSDMIMHEMLKLMIRTYLTFVQNQPIDCTPHMPGKNGLMEFSWLGVTLQFAAPTEMP